MNDSQTATHDETLPTTVSLLYNELMYLTQTIKKECAG